jgi:hypothetical protein
MRARNACNFSGDRMQAVDCEVDDPVADDDDEELHCGRTGIAGG